MSRAFLRIWKGMAAVRAQLFVLSMFLVWAFASEGIALVANKDGLAEHLLVSQGQPHEGVIQPRRLNSAADCVWDKNICSLRSDFVRSLPRVLGDPTTDSAK